MSVSSFGGGESAGESSSMSIGQVVQAAGGTNLLPADGRVLPKLDYPDAYVALNNSTNELATLQANVSTLTLPATVAGASQSVAYNPATDVFAALSGSQILLSTDSCKTWIPYPLPSNGGVQFIAISASDDKFCLLSATTSAISYNGVDWTIGASLPYVPSNAGSFGFAGAGFVYCSGAEYMYSPDGLNWNAPSLPISLVTEIIRQPGGNYIAWGSTTIANAATDRIAISSDGYSWNVRTLPIADTIRVGAATANVICLMSYTRSFTSTDGGETWIATAFTGAFTAFSSTNFNLAATDSTFVLTTVTSTGGAANAIFTSTNGTSWTSIGSYTSLNSNTSSNWFATDGNGVIVLPQVQLSRMVTVSTDNGNSWQLVQLPNTAVWNFVIWTGSLFILLSNTSTTSLKSVDGLNWEVASTTVPVMSGPAGIYAKNSNGLHIITQFGTATNIALSSPDGITWTSRTIPASNTWYGITAKGTGFYLSGPGAVGYYTPDAVTWTSANTGATTGNYMVVANSSVYVRVTLTNSPTLIDIPIHTSSTGLSSSWTSRNLPAVTSNPGFSAQAVFTIGETIWVASFSTNKAYTSTDGVNWTLLNNVWPQTYSVTNGAFICVAKVGGGIMFQTRLSSALDGFMARSSDMVNWTHGTYCVPRHTNGDTVRFAGTNGTNGGGSELIAAMGPFFYKYDDTNGLSVSLLPNTLNTLSPQVGLNAATYRTLVKDGGYYFFCGTTAAATDGKGFYTTDQRASWSVINQPSAAVSDAMFVDGKFAFIGQNGVLNVSSDLINFERQTLSGSGTTGTLSGDSEKAFVTYAFTPNASYTTTTSNLMTFEDGLLTCPVPFLTPTLGTAPGNLIARKGNTAVLGYRSASLIAVTQDGGATWKAVTVSGVSIAAIAYNPVSDVFAMVPVGTSAVCYTSKDGVNWFARSLPASATWYSISVFNGIFIATTSGTSAWAYSVDGISWYSLNAPFVGATNQYYYWAANKNTLLLTLSNGSFAYSGSIMKSYDSETHFQLPSYSQTPGQPGWFVKVK